jgi:RNA-directed DNA polymerase
VDQLLERATEVTRRGPYTYLAYARVADDLVILVDAYPQHDWLLKAVDKRLREELATLQVVLSQVFIYAPLRYALLLLSTVNSEGE